MILVHPDEWKKLCGYHDELPAVSLELINVSTRLLIFLATHQHGSQSKLLIPHLAYVYPPIIYFEYSLESLLQQFGEDEQPQQLFTPIKLLVDFGYLRINRSPTPDIFHIWVDSNLLVSNLVELRNDREIRTPGKL